APLALPGAGREALQVAHERARRELLPVERVVDQQAHELLGLRDGGGFLEPAALEVDERETAQSYRIRDGVLAFGRDRAALDDVPVFACGIDGLAGSHLVRE